MYRKAFASDEFLQDSIEERLRGLRLDLPDVDRYLSAPPRPQTAVPEHHTERELVQRPQSANVRVLCHHLTEVLGMVENY